MRLITIALITLLASCTGEVIHQGNRLDINKANTIQVGDSRFRIEQLLGSPVLHDALHPDRSVYFEEYQLEVRGELHKRRVIVRYDSAGRAANIDRTGLDQVDPDKQEK